MDKPSLLITSLLEFFFTYEIMAVSKAKGVKTVHNKKVGTDTQPLPPDVVSAIKLFSLKQFKKPNERLA